MAKYHRKADTDIRSFRRPPASRNDPGSAILIVTEGVNTEPAYIDRIKEQFAAPTVELVSHGAGRGDPRALADEALRLRESRRKQMRDRKLGIHKLADFDEIWIVFDTDVLTPQKLNDGMVYARSKGIHTALSEPCFEFWLLLHRHYTTAGMVKCKNVIPFLKEHLGWKSYSRDGKKKEEVRAMMEELVNKETLQQAMIHAARVREHHESAGTPFPANPSTEVDQLIHAINNAVSPASKFLK